MKDDLRSTSDRIFADMIHAYHHCIDSQLSDLGLFRGQPPIMGILSHHGEMSQKDLAQKLHLSPATVTVTLKRMQKAGFITRRIDETDQRIQRVSLTEEGKRLDACAREIFRRMGDEIAFAGFSREEKEQMLLFVRRITENLRAGESKMGKEEKEGEDRHE